MGVEGETKASSGYGKPPWTFKGSALYQLHLVKAQTVRDCIPKELSLVEAFGYTLGGFFLASYEDSPAGAFDELVVIAGLVWNPPTSCAWATKVLVNSNEACKHGRKEVGLPSQVASFSKRITAIPREQISKKVGFLNMIGIGTSLSDSKDDMSFQVTEIRVPSVSDHCSFSFNLTTSVPKLNLDKRMGPTIKMSLPSFSGRTPYNPDLLKYSCKLHCRVKPVHPAQISRTADELNSDPEEQSSNLSEAVMLSKPMFALKFSCMTMQVDAPSVFPPHSSKTSLATC